MSSSLEEGRLMAYVTEEQVQAWLQWPTVDANDTAKINRAISAAESTIDRMTGRQFTKDGSNVVRFYDLPNCKNKMYLGDTVSIDTVEFLNGINTYETIPTTDWVLTGARDGRPPNALMFFSRYTPSGQRAVKLTGIFGWDVVPTAIIQATAMLAAKITLRDQSIQGNVIEDPQKGDISVNAYEDKDLMNLITDYKLRTIGSRPGYSDA